MNLLFAILAFLAALVFVLVGVTRVGAWLIERRHPPVGAFVTVNDTRLHYVHVPAPEGAALPALVFVHGASGNLKDQMVPLRPVFEGRAEMLFLDRPGHGWSARGPASNEDPRGQAATLAALMDRLGIGPAIVVGHSFGGATVATFALDHPERVAGLLFLAAATHPWPGGDTSWYYEVAALPLVGRLFSETLAYPGGLLGIRGGTECVFAPNPVPEAYAERASIPLVLRPRHFRANARDVAGLHRYVMAVAPRYPEIATPTVVVSGDSDTIVFEEVHSAGLARDIPGAELVWVANLGHKPEWVAPDLVAAAVERLAGAERDLAAEAARVEARIAGDASGVETCPDEKPEPGAELAAR